MHDAWWRWTAASGLCVAMRTVVPAEKRRGAAGRGSLVAGGGVEIAGGLVGQEEARASGRARGRWPRAASGRRRAGAGRRAARSAHLHPGEALQRRLGARVGRPARRSGSSTFSTTLRLGRSWNDWKMKPTFSRRRRVRAASFSEAVERPSINTSPLVGKSMAPARFSRVDLPQPLRPARAINSPGAPSSETSWSACTAAPSVKYSLLTRSSLRTLTVLAYVSWLVGCRGETRRGKRFRRANADAMLRLWGCYACALFWPSRLASHV